MKVASGEGSSHAALPRQLEGTQRTWDEVDTNYSPGRWRWCLVRLPLSARDAGLPIEISGGAGRHLTLQGQLKHAAAAAAAAAAREWRRRRYCSLVRQDDEEGGLMHHRAGARVRCVDCCA